VTRGGPPDPLYVRARRVLLDALDALDALAPFRDAVILIGAQATYLHSELTRDARNTKIRM
jgi:hypothetical protein